MRNWSQKHIEDVIADELERLSGGEKNEQRVDGEAHKGNDTEKTEVSGH